MAWLLILAPLLMAGFAAAVPSNRWRPWALPAGGLLHLGLTAWTLAGDDAQVAAFDGWIALDAHERSLGEGWGELPDGGIRERVKVVPREEMVRVSRALETVDAAGKADR